ncbi:MAG: hypothetical protein J5677_04785 [Bacteroidales bacterium]|nr:hypothetical protein [Bacteroidales bacterium]
MKRTTILIAIVLTMVFGACNSRNAEYSLPEPAPGFVTLQDGHFAIDGEPWFPLMLNYKAFIDGDSVVAAPWYTGDLRSNFDTIASWGFNAVRVCLDVLPEDGDTAAMFAATRSMIQLADSAGLRVMLLIKAPFNGYWCDYAIGLMHHLADLPALWAYDLMNEPLYFDPEPDRSKNDAVSVVANWHRLVRTHAPHQLFTVATAEPIEVFEWDPSLLPVDFLEIHTYHPLRVQSEMWWYGHYTGKPWMIGETGLPADNHSVSYDDQMHFMRETYNYARDLGAIGYGWWEFQDYPDGVNFEAQYTGLRDIHGHRKPAAGLVAQLGIAYEASTPEFPCNYYNMLAYRNVAVTGIVTDQKGRPIEGAVVRGWNEWWGVGMNTYTDADGRFRLVSNDICVHFEISAPGYSKQKFDHTPIFPSDLELPDREREYQQMPLTGWGPSDGRILPHGKQERFEAPTAVEASIGKIALTHL